MQVVRRVVVGGGDDEGGAVFGELRARGAPHGEGAVASHRRRRVPSTNNSAVASLVPRGGVDGEARAVGSGRGLHGGDYRDRGNNRLVRHRRAADGVEQEALNNVLVVIGNVQLSVLIVVIVAERSLLLLAVVWQRRAGGVVEGRKGAPHPKAAAAINIAGEARAAERLPSADRRAFGAGAVAPVGGGRGRGARIGRKGGFVRLSAAASAG